MAVLYLGIFLSRFPYSSLIIIILRFVFLVREQFILYICLLLLLLHQNVSFHLRMHKKKCNLIAHQDNVNNKNISKKNMKYLTVLFELDKKKKTKKNYVELSWTRNIRSRNQNKLSTRKSTNRDTNPVRSVLTAEFKLSAVFQSTSSATKQTYIRRVNSGNGVDCVRRIRTQTGPTNEMQEKESRCAQ